MKLIKSFQILKRSNNMINLVMLLLKLELDLVAEILMLMDLTLVIFLVIFLVVEVSVALKDFLDLVVLQEEAMLKLGMI